MKPILYSEEETTFTNNGIGILCDTTFCNVTEERNGSYEIEFSYPITGAHFADIEENCFVKAKPNETSDPQIFRIYKSTKPINGVVTFSGEHISYELTGNPIEKVVITNATAAQALNSVLNASLIPHSYSGLSDISSRGTTTLSLISTRAALGGVEGSLLDTYGGEYEFDNFVIKLHQSRGSDTGIIIGYGKNLTDLTQEKNISETYTALFPYAKYTPEKEEGDEEEPEEVIVTLSEKIIYSSSATRPKVLTMDFSDKFSDGEEITETALRQKATAWAAKSGYNEPSVSIKVSFTHLWQSPEYKQYAALERVSLCDIVTVKFEKLGVSAKAKVIKTVYDTLREKYVSIELGDAKSNFADSINQTTREIENIKTDFKKSETATANKITEAIKTATALITGQNGGYVVLNPSNNPQEILIMDAPSVNEAVKIWRWNSAGLGYSSNGYNGPFTLAITKDGSIVADFITTGELNGAIIKADSVSASAISQSFKQDIQNSLEETTQTITQLFEAADGAVRSEIEAVFNSAMYEDATRRSAYPTKENTSYEEKNKMYFCTTDEKYYRWNRISEEWIIAKDSSIYSAFIQTADGFKFSGLVKIDGDLLVENSISASAISQEYKAEVNNAINDVSEELTQSFRAADGVVNSTIQRKFNASMYEDATRRSAYPTNANTTDEEKMKLYFCTSNEKFYHYNEVSSSWVENSDQCIYSAFKQTASGFELSGIVKINGNLITTGTISAARIDTENLSCTRLYAKGNVNGYSTRLNGNLGDFGIFTPSASESESANGSNCLFGIYHSLPNVNFYVRANNFMGYDTTNKILYPEGKWNFSNATITGLSAIATFG